jgi:hypothetical protein
MTRTTQFCIGVIVTKLGSNLIRLIRLLDSSFPDAIGSPHTVRVGADDYKLLQVADQFRREAIAGVGGLGRARHGRLITDPCPSGNPPCRQLDDALLRTSGNSNNVRIRKQSLSHSLNIPPPRRVLLHIAGTFFLSIILRPTPMGPRRASRTERDYKRATGEPAGALHWSGSGK